MNEFYEEPRQLNMKKVIGILSIFVIIVLIIIIVIAKKISTPKQNPNEEITEKTTIFSSTDKSVNLEISNTFGLKSYDSNLSYLLELRSDSNLNIFISKENLIQNKSLHEIVEADKVAYLSKFDSCSNLSDIKELTVNGNPAYTYSFHYLDKKLNEAYYLQIVWLEHNNNYYIFDIEFPLDDLVFNTNTVSEVLSNFKINDSTEQL